MALFFYFKTINGSTPLSRWKPPPFSASASRRIADDVFFWYIN
jgi:hypothetical protein